VLKYKDVTSKYPTYPHPQISRAHRLGQGVHKFSKT